MRKRIPILLPCLYMFKILFDMTNAKSSIQREHDTPVIKKSKTVHPSSSATLSIPKKSKVSVAFDNFKAEPDGKDQCFEECRAEKKYFKTVKASQSHSHNLITPNVIDKCFEECRAESKSYILVKKSQSYFNDLARNKIVQSHKNRPMRRSREDLDENVSATREINCRTVVGNLDNRRAKGTDYVSLHGKNINSALSIMTRRALLGPSATRLDERVVLDRKKLALPRGLKRIYKHDVNVNIGGQEIIVKNKLGSGAYGMVILCSTPSSPDENVAMKIQEDPKSLAWEYEILEKVETRLKKETEKYGRSISSPTPFPVALTFMIFNNGATMGMTAGSCTGLNLLDIINAHKRSVPELLAIHYTSRMLKHMETLHLTAKVLVSKSVGFFLCYPQPL